MKSKFSVFFGKIAACVKSDASYAFFCAFVFLSMVSLPLARAAMVASFVALICSKAARARFRLTPPTVGWYVYFILALVVTVTMAMVNSEWGVAHHLVGSVDPYIEPARGCRKLTKLLWYLAIPVTVVNVNTSKRFRSALSFMVTGGLCLAFFVILFHPLYAWLQVHFHCGVNAIDRLFYDSTWSQSGGRPPSFHLAFIVLGTMHDAQRLMTALVASVALLLSDYGALDGRRRFVRIAGTAVLALALVFACKRGPLFVGIIISLLLLLPRIKIWRALLVLAAVSAIAFAVPNFRTRLLDLPNEFSVYRVAPTDNAGQKPRYIGGRMLMWTKVVPAVHKEYPLGIGFRALTSEKMRSIDHHVEKKRTHVHSVPLQAFVDFSYAGVVAWAIWFGLSFASAVRVRRTLDACGECLPSFAPLAMLAALFIFGFVEYNIADSAVVLPLSVVMGLCAVKFDV